jgi:terminase small subunit-like protein
MKQSKKRPKPEPEAEVLKPEPCRKPTGRPSSYAPEAVQEILDRIMCGEMLAKICLEEHLPTRLQFYGWMNSRPALQSSYARARLAWADWWAERVLAISLDGSGDIVIDGAGKAMIDHANVQRARLAADSIKWLVGKWAPRTYGDKPQLEEEAKTLTIQWQATDGPAPPVSREPPKQLVYRQPELPGDLTPADWQKLLAILEVVKRVAPSDAPPPEVLDVVRKALLDHFADK